MAFAQMSRYISRMVDVADSRFFRSAWRLCVIIVPVLLCALGLLFSARVPIWGPRDEIAHYDYIDKLGNWRIPRPSEPISQYTYNLCRHFDWLAPPNYNGTIESMGMAGTSYEAQQAPLYYALLAPPNVLMKRRHVRSDIQIKVLRSFGIFALLGSGWLLIASFGIVHEITNLPRSYGLLSAVLAFQLYSSYHSTLSNDCLSLFTCCLTLYASLRFFRDNRVLWLLLSAAGSLAAVNVKVINFPLAFIPALAVFVQSRYNPGSVNAARVGISVSTILLAPLWSAVQFLELHSLLPGLQVARIFSAIAHPVPRSADFAELVIMDAFMLDSDAGLPAKTWFWLPFLSFAVNFSWSLWIAIRKKKPEGVPVVIACVVAALSLFLAEALNRTIPGVHWVAFRHYLAYAPFWLAAVVAYPVRSTKLTEEILLLMSLLVGCYSMFSIFSV